MPGLDREVSKKEFFDTMSDYIKPLAEKSDRIGFLFFLSDRNFPR